MALSLYLWDEGTSSFVAVSSGTLTNPVEHSLDSGRGESNAVRFFIGADNLNQYTAITLGFNPSADTLAGNKYGLTFKLLCSESEPTETMWAAQTSGASLTSVTNWGTAPLANQHLPEIGVAGGVVSTAKVPVWVQVVARPGSVARLIDGIDLELTFTET